MVKKIPSIQKTSANSFEPCLKQQQNSKRRLEFENQNSRLINLLEYEQSNDTMVNVRKWKDVIEKDEAELLELKNREQESRDQIEKAEQELQARAQKRNSKEKFT